MPAGLRPATAPRYFPPVKSGAESSPDLTPENPDGVAERLRAQADARESVAADPADPLATRIRELEAELARGAGGAG